MQLFDGQSANGNSAVMEWPGGTGTLQIAGTWDGATATLQVSLDGGTTWTDTDATYTDDDVDNIEIACPAKVRLNLASVGTTSLNAWRER